MKQLRLVMIVLTFAGVATPAHAALIGLTGGDIDPQSIFDPTSQPLVSGCLLVPSSLFCAQYEILPDVGDDEIFIEQQEPNFVLHSIDFRLLKSSDEFFTTDTLGNCEIGLCVDVELSDLDNLVASSLFDDGITFRLFGNTIFCFPGVPDCDAEFFSTDPSPGVSVVAVNGVRSVPEPAILLLMGPAAAGLAARRRRQSSKQARLDAPTSAGTSQSTA